MSRRRLHPSRTPRWPLRADILERFPSRRAFCDQTRISALRLRELEAGAKLSNLQADRVAGYLQVHPCELWVDWFNLRPDEIYDLDLLCDDLTVVIDNGDDLKKVRAIISSFITDGLDTIEHLIEAPEKSPAHRR